MGIDEVKLLGDMSLTSKNHIKKCHIKETKNCIREDDVII